MTTDPAMLKARERAAANALPYDVQRYLEGAHDENPAMIALAKTLQEFSDAVEAYHRCPFNETMDALRAFTLPKPRVCGLQHSASASGIAVWRQSPDP